jgi:ABC-type Mn2+/Zn2+ transport system ATPase subunit
LVRGVLLPEISMGGSITTHATIGNAAVVPAGMELITNPSVLLLDEPTSGLDSKSAASVVEILLKLARDHNRTIICTIHSPSSHIFQMFDDLMVPHCCSPLCCCFQAERLFDC